MSSDEISSKKDEEGEEGELEDSDCEVKEKNEMELTSDSEENEINVKPIAMSIKFYKDKPGKNLRHEIIRKFGAKYVEKHDSCLFVYPEKSSKEIDKNVVNPSGMLRVLFHDEEFRDTHLESMIELLKKLFGRWKVTNDDASIDVFEEDILDFEMDTSTRSHHNFIYNKQTNKPKQPNQSNCFNCNGPHSLQNCQEPKNFQRINENRQKFMANKTQIGKKRYHFERDQFSGIGPGHLTPELRKALNLTSNQLPKFIYEMRKFGYPPAWLLEAKIKHSGFAVYGKDGAVPEEGDETGEVFDEGQKDRYDVKKLIRFPGFNSPMPDNTIDEFELHGSPPFSEAHSLETMTKNLGSSIYIAYKKRKAINTEVPDSPECNSSPKTPVIKTPKQESTPIRVNLGTPLLPAMSPYSKLPERNKFGVNISDVLNFENLPDATGTYEKVATSISKIREFTKNNID